MSDNALQALQSTVYGIVTVSAIVSATVLAVMGAPMGFTICAGLLSLICVFGW